MIHHHDEIRTTCGYLFNLNHNLCTLVVFEKGDEQDSEAGEETREEPFDEDVDLYSSVLKKILPGKLSYFLC